MAYRVGVELKDNVCQRQEDLEHGLLRVDLSLHAVLVVKPGCGDKTRQAYTVDVKVVYAIAITAGGATGRLQPINKQ